MAHIPRWLSQWKLSNCMHYPMIQFLIMNNRLFSALIYSLYAQLSTRSRWQSFFNSGHHFTMLLIEVILCMPGFKITIFGTITVSLSIRIVNVFLFVIAIWVRLNTPERAVWVRALVGGTKLCSWERHFSLTVLQFASKTLIYWSIDWKFATNSPIYQNLTRRSRDLSRGQDNMLRQRRTSSFVIREKFSLVKQIYQEI